MHNVSFSIEPGQLVALLDPNDAGKPTLAYLLARLYGAESGLITIDGRGIK